MQGDGSALVDTKEYLEIEKAEAAKCTQLFQHIQTCEQQNPISLKVLLMGPLVWPAASCLSAEKTPAYCCRVLPSSLQACAQPETAGLHAAVACVTPTAARCSCLTTRLVSADSDESVQALHERAVPYLQIRKALVGRLVSTAGALGLGQVCSPSSIVSAAQAPCSAVLISSLRCWHQLQRQRPWLTVQFAIFVVL